MPAKLKDAPKTESTAIPVEVEGFIEQETALEISKSQTSLAREAAELKVTSKETYDQAIGIGIQNKHRITQIENLRLAIVKPIKDHLKNIDKFFAQMAAPFQAIDADVRGKILKYQTSLKKPEAIKNRTIDDGSRATISMVMKYEIIDENKVPRAFLCVNEAALGRAVRARAVGVVETGKDGKPQSAVPGIRIWEEPQTSFVPEK